MKRYRLLLPNGKPRKFAKGCKPGKPAEYPTPTDGAGFSEALDKALVRYPPPKRDDPLLTKRGAATGSARALSPADAGLDPAHASPPCMGVSRAEAAALPTAVKLHGIRRVAENERAGTCRPLTSADYGTDYTTGERDRPLPGLVRTHQQEAIYPVGVERRQRRPVLGRQ